ncbi:MAG: hypothetical protein ACI9MC_004179 [Kiritimatiellia bacterium]|jgi:hypothetical protein
MTRHLMTLFAAAALFVSCTSNGALKEGECYDNGNCDEGMACIEGQCETVDCLDSTVCRVGEYCDLDNYVCRAGCNDDHDCIAGESCDTALNTCETYGCRDTDLDCSIGEACNQVTGQCDRDPRAHCSTCTYDVWTGQDDCPTSATCLSFEGEEDGFCFFDCRLGGPDDQCPRGFECADYGAGAACVAYCPLLRDNGWYP